MTDGESTENRSEKLWRVRSWFPDLGDEKLNALRLFHMELIRFNQKTTLISRKTEVEADRIHFADGIIGGQAILEADPAKEIFDIGSGSGIPGLIMAVLAPDRKIVLIEGDGRKVEFIKHMVEQLELGNVQVGHMRIEDLQPNSIECAVSRGFASIPKSVVALRKAFVKGGRYYHFKTDNWVREIGQMPTQVISIWTPKLFKEYTLPESVDRGKNAVVVTNKTAR